jgi:hypothetical protein
MRPDPSKPAAPLGPGYGEGLVKRIKDFLEDMAEKKPVGIGWRVLLMIQDLQSIYV